ncbi:MAG: hypothetical protein ABSE93_19860 [Terriglobia bacterium]|jgi:hypothetical protein
MGWFIIALGVWGLVSLLRKGWRGFLLVILVLLTVASGVLLLISILALLDGPTDRFIYMACASGTVLLLSCWAAYRLEAFS